MEFKVSPDHIRLVMVANNIIGSESNPDHLIINLWLLAENPRKLYTHSVL